MVSLRLRQAARWIVAITLVACADRVTAPVMPTRQPAALATIRCEADVRFAAVTCAGADTSHMSSSVRLGAGASADLQVGGQNVYVTLTSSNVTYTSNVFGFDVTVKNLIPQALGTTDGTTTDPNGVRVFFSAAPSTTGGTGTVTVANADGTATFTASNQSYFQYNTMLAQNATSSSKHWQLNVPATVTSFQFVVYVDAAVQYPNGWITISPANDTVLPGGNATLGGTVYDAVGRTVTGHTLTWTSKYTSVATINSSSGAVTAVNPGTDTITVTDGTVNGSTPFVTKNTAPTLVAQAYKYPGNVAIPVDSAHGFMAGMSDPDASQNHTLTSPTGTSTLASGATITANANGSFTYTPAAGQTGTDSIPYTVTDGIDTTKSYAKVALQGGMHWYVDNTASSSGADGRQSHPYTSLASLTGHTAANDTIFVNAGSGNTTAGYTLTSGEALLGQAALASNLTVVMNGATITEFSTGGAPHLVAASGTALTLGSGNTIKGAYISSSSGTALSGTSFGTLTLSADSIVAAGGPSLSLTTGSIASGSTILFAKSSSSGSYGLNLSGVSGGTLTISNDTILNPTTAGVRIASGSVSLTTSAGAITTTTGGARPVDINSNTGGTLNLAETITANAGTQSGLSIATNTGTTITLSGNMTVSTGANAAFTATGGGTINVTGTTNTLSTTTGTALNVANTTIGASGITFKTITTSGSANGIVLNTTGSLGGLTVTGDGQSSTSSTTIGRTTSKQGGGTISLGSGGTISAPTGVGVSLSSTSNVVLRNMVIQNGSGGAGTGNHGVSASSVTNLTLDNDLVTGFTGNMGVYTSSSTGLSVIHSEFTNNASASASASTLATDEYFNFRNDNLGGTNSITYSKFVTSLFGGFGIIQNSSASPSITFSNDSLKSAASDSTTTGITARDGAATGWFLGSSHSGTVTLTASNNAYDGDYVEFEVLQQGNGTINYTFSSNKLRQKTYGAFSAIYVKQLGTTVTSGLISGTMSSNAIGTSIVPASTQLDAATFLANTNATGGTIRTTFTNNTILNAFGDNALDVEYGYNSTNMQFKISGNDLESTQTSNPNTFSAFQFVAHGSGALCLDMRSNTKFVGDATNSYDAGYFDENGFAPNVTFVMSSTSGWNTSDIPGSITTYLNASATTVSQPLQSGLDVANIGGTNTATTTACNTP